MGKKHELLGKYTEVTFKHWKASSSTYRRHTKSGFKGTKWEGHHVVPGTSMEQSLETFLATKAETGDGYNKALSYFTHWDLNHAPNMLGLPTETTYREAYRNSTRPIQLDIQMPANLKMPMPVTKMPFLPIHNPVDWGHTDFNENVKLKLDRIWANLNAKFEKHEPVEAADMQASIQNVSDAYRKTLQVKTLQTKQDWDLGNYAQFRMV
jgi:hypothetical protein